VYRKIDPGPTVRAPLTENPLKVEIARAYANNRCSTLVSSHGHDGAIVRVVATSSSRYDRYRWTRSAVRDALTTTSAAGVKLNNTRSAFVDGAAAVNDHRVVVDWRTRGRQ